MKWRRRVAVLAKAGVACAGLATLCALAATWWWPLELFSHFRVQYVAGALVLAAALAITRDRGWMAAAVVLGVLNAVAVVPELGAHRPPTPGPPAADAVRMLSLNVFDLNRQHDRMVDFVRRRQTDVVLLVELTPEWLPSVERLKADYPYRWLSTEDPDSGIVMMTRRKPVAVETLSLRGSQTPAYLLTFAVGGRRLSIVGTQAQWPVSSTLARDRNEQLAALATLARSRTEPLAIVGDLNVSPFSPYYARLRRDGGLRPCAGNGRWTPTWPTIIPPLLIQLDHCLTTDGVESWDFSPGEYLGSDHYPITVTLAPRPSG